MLNPLRVLDAPEFFRPLREVLLGAARQIVPRDAGQTVGFTIAEHAGGTTTWKLQIRGHTTLLLRLIRLREVLIECHDRDIFEASLPPLQSFLSFGGTADGRTRSEMTTCDFPVTIVYHDNDTCVSR